jgi:DNA-binding SARP family transcriptional activator
MASYGGAVLDLGGRRQRAVLAVLVLARGEVVPAERLADAVWGDRPPGNTAGALQSYVSHLRRSLQPGTPARTRSAVIVRERAGYVVRLPTDAVDAWLFEELLKKSETADPAQTAALLREALDLWRGPALVEYAEEPWAEAEIARLTELRQVARERLSAARLELGEAALVVRELEAMAAEEPLREERWRLLALGLYRAQRQADALAALRQARQTLADELGVDPGPALRALEAQVLAHSPALVSAERPQPHSPPRGRAPAATRDRDDLVARDGELAVLRSMLDRLSAGDHGLLLVDGPAGIGKSRLLAELRSSARRKDSATGLRRGHPSPDRGHEQDVRPGRRAADRRVRPGCRVP